MGMLEADTAIEYNFAIDLLQNVKDSKVWVLLHGPAGLAVLRRVEAQDGHRWFLTSSQAA